MRGVGYRVVRLLRAQWRMTAALTLAIAAVTGAVLAFAAGAERTSTAPDRFTASFEGGFDGSIEQQEGAPRTTEVAALPGASSVSSITFVFGGLMPEGGGEPLETLVFAGSHEAFGTRLVEGRSPDPDRRGEFVATRTFVDRHRVGLGSKATLVTLSQEQADTGGFDAFAEGPQGPSLEAELVGIVDGPVDLSDPNPVVAFSPSLLDGGDVAISATHMVVRLAEGTGLARFRTALDELPDGSSLSLEPAQLIPADVRTAVEAQARGIWVLALFTAIAAVVVLGQLVTRSVRLPGEERRRLAALGCTRAQMLGESTWRAAVPILAGTLIGVAIAAAASSSFPSGFVRRLEPDPGTRVDVGVLVPGVAALAGALLAWTVLSLVADRGRRGVIQPSPLVEAVASRTRGGALATGLRFAFTRTRRDRWSVRGTVAGMLGTAALLVGSIVFGDSLNRLISDEARFGTTHDLLSGTGGDAVPEELMRQLEADPDVNGITLYAVTEARAGSVSVGLAGMQPVQGSDVPVVLAGRLPRSDDEIAPGRRELAEIDADVGETITLRGEGPPRRFRVTGIAVVPGVEGLDGVGKDAVVTLGGLRRIAPDAAPSVAAVTVRPGAVEEAGRRYGLGQVDPPGVIRNLVRVQSVPYLLAAVLGALAVMTVVHVMVTSIRNRRRDVALLRALGADGPWISRAVHWQASTFVLVTLALGAPLGLIAGRLVFKLFVDNIGAVPEASIPFSLLAAIATGLVVLANLVAALPAMRARRSSPARVLAVE